MKRMLGIHPHGFSPTHSMLVIFTNIQMSASQAKVREWQIAPTLECLGYPWFEP